MNRHGKNFKNRRGKRRDTEAMNNALPGDHL